MPQVLTARQIAARLVNLINAADFDRPADPGFNPDAPLFISYPDAVIRFESTDCPLGFRVRVEERTDRNVVDMGLPSFLVELVRQTVESAGQRPDGVTTPLFADRLFSVRGEIVSVREDRSPAGMPSVKISTPRMTIEIEFPSRSESGEWVKGLTPSSVASLFDRIAAEA